MEKKLIVYYSYTNNTKKVAEKIQKATGLDICRIETVKPYTGDYNSVVDQGKQEVDSGHKPAIKPLSVNLEDYDTIILGIPVWWYTYAPAVATFLFEYDLSGKTIVPFVTNGGWIGHTIKDIKKVCKNTIVTNEIDIRFDTDKMAMPESNLEKWSARL
ncbi:NAD(P)H-dependent oxidoreductase [Clostridium tyrobutyricum]|uniref:flavodoxin n=1 Tax=Clostridium tyrobutyricum TaxID=1519 RepID=UPI001C38691E|nr:flavodoxin [Clostridium tyrobutyricum]MBV4417965.1 NAD(P)H-dependent oxidoreductase [Clostridium tyrobutyricum]MBV4425288.1 NAD(P)H-dependent oxidoreductase [Clostridium tyrobutyricum]MBV4446929.1 NAD(P)H-dependent oxidoreductase [Clostridium tyrobutyricum]